MTGKNAEDKLMALRQRIDSTLGNAAREITPFELLQLNEYIKYLEDRLAETELECSSVKGWERHWRRMFEQIVTEGSPNIGKTLRQYEQREMSIQALVEAVEGLQLGKLTITFDDKHRAIDKALAGVKEWLEGEKK